MSTRKILFLICILSPALVWGQSGWQFRLDSLVNAKMMEYRIQGLSVSIVKDGRQFYSKGYGYTGVDSLHPVSPDTRFVIASITKLFTATSVMQLVEEGKLDISKKLVDYLPDFRMKDERYKEITIQQLLTHSSGLPWDNELTENSSDSLALKTFVYSLKNTRLRFDPGKKFSRETYSNTGYDILGYLVEFLSKTPYQDYIKKKILDQTDMMNSTFSVKSIPSEQLALPMKISGNSRELKRFNLYGEIKGETPVLKYPELPVVVWDDYQWGKPEHYPSGYLYSTAGDLSKWIIRCLEVYHHAAGKFLKDSTMKKMWTVQRKIENKNTSIGLGWWRVTDSLNGDYLFHVGRDPGYSATLRIYPEKNIGITILTNAMYADRVVWNDLSEAILKVVSKESKPKDAAWK